MARSKGLLRMYRHSFDENEMGREIFQKGLYVVGPTLQGIFGVLGSQGLEEKDHVVKRDSRRSDKMHDSIRRLYDFRRGSESNGHMPDANIFEVAMRSKEGSSHYLSFILSGIYHASTIGDLTRLGFSPEHTFSPRSDEIAKGDRIAILHSFKELWLNHLIPIPHIPFME